MIHVTQGQNVMPYVTTRVPAQVMVPVTVALMDTGETTVRDMNVLVKAYHVQDMELAIPLHMCVHATQAGQALAVIL